MRVAVLCFPTPGGSGVVAVELAREMARRGHEIHLVSYAKPFRLTVEKNIFYHEVALRQFPLFPYPLFSLETAARLAAVLKECSPQVIHAHYALPHSVAAILARQIAGAEEVKIVTTVHGTDISTWGHDPQLGPLVRYGLEKSDAVTAVSFSLRRETAALLGLKQEQEQEKIAVIYNFIDLERYRREVNSKLLRELAPRGEKIVMHISNFRPVKRVTDLIRAFALLLREKKDVVLVLVGDGVEKEKVARMVGEMGLAAHVRFLGVQADPVPLLSCADLLVLPSARESFGLVALEAMACAVPVIAANTGGLLEVVSDGQTGLLFPVYDFNALAAAMRRLLTDGELHGRLAAAARRRAEQFSAARIVPYYEELYYRLVPRL